MLYVIVEKIMHPIQMATDAINEQDYPPGLRAVGPALRIFQLNVDGLSAAKRSISAYPSDVRGSYNVDVCKKPTFASI